MQQSAAMSATQPGAAAKPRARRRPLLPTLALTLLLAACGSSTGTPAPATSQAPASAAPQTAAPSPQASLSLPEVYAQINQQVQAIRGLPEKQPVTPTIVSPDEMAAILKKQNDIEEPPALLAAYERLYHGMGVLPKTDKLADVFLDLLSSQVGGMYVPSDKKLYVVSKAGVVGPLEKFLYSHEYTHALQDQNFDLQKFQPDSLQDQSDEQMARQAVVEGDAYVTMTYWLQQHASATDRAAVLAGSSDPKAQQALERIPPLIASQILFSALQGTVWVLQQQIGGGWDAINSAFANPPQSTEQILHPDKWASREAPIDVQLPADLATKMGKDWKVGLQDTFGEHQLGVWITNEIPDTAALPGPPPESAAGWGGDRVALLDGPNGAWAIVLKTAWDTAKDAAEFEAAIAPRVAQAGGPGQVLPGEGGTVRWVVIGSDDATLAKAANVVGLAG
jgi:hypothetical protein